MGDAPSSPPITSKQQLIGWFEKGCKPKKDWRIGTEHEKFGFYTADLKPVPFEGENGIETLLNNLKTEFNWQPIYENEKLIALSQKCEIGQASITLEPGGQLELSGAPLENIHQTCAEVQTHLDQVHEVAEPLGIAFIGLGFTPKTVLQNCPIMPKGRYDIMRPYMEKKGSRGQDMMFRTATVQVNLDFSDEGDMVKKMRVALALQPIASAIFANSPFRDGRPQGALSERALVWHDTDPDRTGLMPFVFDEAMSFERYVDYALDVPMYFVYREGIYHDVSGLSFRDFLNGNLSGFEGELPTLDDWSDHLTTLFPEARLKRFIEMRGADGGPRPRICALSAFWTGLLYDSSALDAAWDLVKNWDGDTREMLRREVPIYALDTITSQVNVAAIAKDVIDISESGLNARAIKNTQGENESIFLSPIREIISTGKTGANNLLDQYHHEWNEEIDEVFRACAY